METNEILRNLREDKDLKQENLAKELNIVQQTYSSYENGHTQVPINNLIKLAKFYNVTTDYLLGLTTFQQPVKGLTEIYTKEKTVGEVTTKLLKLSPDKRKTLLEFLEYLIEKERK